MRSTAYVIELIIAGVGSLAWMALIVFSIFGYEWLPVDLVFKAGFVIIISPFIYVVGVVTDRLVDNLFDRRFKENPDNPDFLEKEAYIRARTKIYLASDNLRDLLEYGKMRIRICRAWAFNSFFLMILGTVFVFTLSEVALGLRTGIAGLVFIFFGLSTLLSFRAWKMLSIKEAEFLRIQGEILEELLQEKKG